jgi:adenine phosphoribosyltransferase
MSLDQLRKELIRIKDSESDYLIPSHSSTYQEVIMRLIKPFRKSKITKVVAVDMKGLMYGPVIANKLNLPFVPLLKGGKIGRRGMVLKSKNFKDYTSKYKSIELFKSSISSKDRILLVDDWFESGKTGKSSIRLIEQRGAKVVGISVIFNQLLPKDEKFFDLYDFHYLVRLKPRIMQGMKGGKKMVFK